MGPEPSSERSPLDDDRVLDQARSPEARERLKEHERRIYIPLLLSALLPIVVAASRSATDSRVSIVVNVIAWFVFVYDLFVHIRLERHYLRTKVGVFDLVVVILTAPWFLIPGFGGSQILMLARLARLVRLFFVSKSARQLGRRLGSVGLHLRRHAAVLLVDGLRRRAPHQPRVRHLRRLALVGHRHPHHGRLRRHRAG